MLSPLRLRRPADQHRAQSIIHNPAGLYLPTSDVDAVVVNSGCTDIPTGLKALAQSLLRKHLAKQMQVGGAAAWGR